MGLDNLRRGKRSVFFLNFTIIKEPIFCLKLFFYNFNIFATLFCCKPYIYIYLVFQDFLLILHVFEFKKKIIKSR